MKPTDDTHEEVGALIRATVARVEAPASLRAGVEGLAAKRRRPARRMAAGLAFAGTAAAALAVALVLALGGSSPGGPSLADAAVAALQPTAGPAPSADPARPAELDASIDGIAFPLWNHRFALRATGARDDKLDGRRALTVGYAGAGGRRVGYTILAAPPLAVPGSARRLTRDGTEFAVWRRAGATVVTWRRAGHTCVLASRTMSARQMLDLAAWTGGGAVGGYPR
jgi:hypothetical protein